MLLPMNINGTRKIPIKKYKALMIDVDGTLIPNKRDGMPSERVTRAIAKGSEILHVGIATSRPIFLLHNSPEKILFTQNGFGDLLCLRLK